MKIRPLSVFGAKSRPGRLQEAPVSDLAFGAVTLLAPVWSKTVLQGTIWGPSWGPKSVKNHTFGPRSAQGPSKNDVWRRYLGPLENVLFFGWFFHGFRLHFGSLFKWVFMFCSLLFRGCFFDVFFSFLDCFSNCANPKIIENSLGFNTLFCIRHFSKTMNFRSDVRWILGLFSHRFFINFHDFFGFEFSIDFCIDFSWKMASKGRPKVIVDAERSPPHPKDTGHLKAKRLNARHRQIPLISAHKVSVVLCLGRWSQLFLVRRISRDTQFCSSGFFELILRLSHEIFVELVSWVVARVYAW